MVSNEEDIYINHDPNPNFNSDSNSNSNSDPDPNYNFISRFTSTPSINSDSHLGSHPNSTFQSYLNRAKGKSSMIIMALIANFILFYSLHLLNVRFCEAFPYLVPEVEKESVFNNIFSSLEGLEDLVNSYENKDIFSQLKYSGQAFYDNELNVVGTLEFPLYNKYQRQPYVANGYIGSRIPNLGHGFTYDQLPDTCQYCEDDLSNGWPLFNKRFAGAFIAGFYDLQENTTGTNFPELLENGYESVIAAVPQWTTLNVAIEANGQNYTLDPSLETHEIGNITNYVQNMSLSNGIVTTQYTWLHNIDIKYTVVAHRAQPNLGLVTLDIQSRSDEVVNLRVEDILDFNTSQRCELTALGHDELGIYITFQPENVDSAHGAIYSRLIESLESAGATGASAVSNLEKVSDGERISQIAKITLEPFESTQINKVVGIVSSDSDPENLGTAKSVRESAKEAAQKYNNIQDILTTHNDAWTKLLGENPRVTFPSEPLLNLAARASVYHLLANTRPQAFGLTGAVGVGGLSSDSYAGMVFWDTDLWMFNGILPLMPSHAKSIVNYRLHLHEQAVQNVPEGYNGAVYPWTSGRYGNCTATGPCLNYEYHINTAVAMAAWELYISGASDELFLREYASTLINNAATFFSDYLVQWNDTLGQYTTSNLTDPDEYANHVDNGAYTNSGISLLMQWATMVGHILGEDVPDVYSQIAENIHIPSANNSQNITLEYSGMNSTVGIKQADVIMMTYPLANNLIDEEQGYINMEYYSMRQVSYGPAMTFPIFSIVASKLAVSGCASQSYLHKAVQPYLRGPFAQFSEQNNDDYKTNGGTHPAFPFLTAHGGFLQAALHGLTGMRHRLNVSDTGVIERFLFLDPIALPCLGEGVLFNSVFYNNHTISMSINQTHFTIENNGKTSDSQNADGFITLQLAERNPDHGTFVLSDGEKRSFALYKPEKSFVDSISECGDASFYNITEGAYGVTPISINDGDNTTRWQAKTNDTVGKILVDLHSIKNVSSVLFNWADRPPLSLKVSKYIGDKFTQVTDFLSQVDFGNEVYKNYRYANPNDKLYNQSEVFEEVSSQDVSISEPFSQEEFDQVLVPVRHNATLLDLEIQQCRFILIEVEGVHDNSSSEEDGDESYSDGAKLAEVAFF
ncbi:alpha,alpha-trehalase [Lodderomyces elongisporus]|uniref:alpha,alpha-trehalase n=1 Tax=Lodderomyces elongisporus TaxID=36914 RepID=UPI00291F9431|nr:alpha,alpha-trehalase [Lodderomyces elongisporus]WLF77070.1 alpha,alpha-trehalase [Lodderomyces elongisporus]